MKSWSLEDVEKSAKENQNSFFIPSKKERNSQKIGKLVRLHFLLDKRNDNDPRAERMWVKIIKEKSIFGKYIGVLTNQPKYIKDLKVNDQIEFDSCNIAMVLIDKDDPNWLECGEQSALVSKMLFDKKEIVRFLYREKADRKEDSGWRLFTGLEDDEYNSNSENIQIVNVYYLIDKDPTLFEPLKGDYGSVYERENIKDSWHIVEDWSPAEE